MRLILLPFAVVAFACLVTAYDARRSQKLSLNPTNLHAKRLTNAQRLARGLTPAPPKFSSGKRLAGRAGPSATPTTVSTDIPSSAVSSVPVSPTSSAASTVLVPPTSSAAPTSTNTPTSSTPAPSSSCSTHTGLLRLTGGSYTGYYISSSANTFGEYGPVNDAAQALRVQYTSCDASSGPFNVKTLNGISAFPNLGGIAGFGNTVPSLGAGLRNYLYMGGTQQSDAGTAPQAGSNSFSAASNTARDYESDIWDIDPTTNEFTAHWVNADGSLPPTVFAINSNIVVIAGDITVFSATYGVSPIVTITFVEETTATSTVSVL